jgi:hypothetical protein
MKPGQARETAFEEIDAAWRLPTNPQVHSEVLVE